MRNEIRQALQDYQNHFGEEILASKAVFNVKKQEAFPSAATDPIQALLSSAIGGMDAFSRIKNSASRNMTADVNSLSRELHKKYFIDDKAAKVVIECIAELLGYTSPTDNEPLKPAIQPTPVGDVVQFGGYSWRVLDTQGDKMLLISEDILEQRAFHPCYAGVTWENSTLRQYLNIDFYNLFDEAERENIVETKLTNPDNHWYGINGGNDTVDKIFILSLEEVDRYFGNSGDYLSKRRKKYDNGSWVFDDNGWILSNKHDSSRIAKLGGGMASFWWLRSPGYSDCTVAYVSTTGNIPPNGDRVCIGRGGVRPALWVTSKEASL